MCYTYDSLNRVTARTIKNATTNAVISTETYTYDAAGNITDAPDACFAYGTNNKLAYFNGQSVSYDADGNLLQAVLDCCGCTTFTYDSANRLVSADGHTYTYNAENVRIRNLCECEDTTYTYNTNCKLSQILTKTTNGVVTRYVYGKGLIGEEVSGAFKTYHFDARGSTIAITDASGNITDTFAYDTYGKLISRTGASEVIFGYNGRDGVVTDDNGLIYMRARYYSPTLRRFLNADVIAGDITNAVTLNRFAYANGNPVSFVDPMGLSVGSWLKDKWNSAKDWVEEKVIEPVGQLVDWMKEDPRNAIDFALTTANAVVSYKVGKLVDAGVSAVVRATTMDPILADTAGDAAGTVAGAATFGLINNAINFVYYTFFADGESSTIQESGNEEDPSYYVTHGFGGYLNRFDRLDHAKKMTGEKYYNVNAWRYYSEYGFHMYAWMGLNWAHEKDYGELSKLAKRAHHADVDEENWEDWGENWYRNLAYIFVGLLGM